jgi:hypothetical protein
MMMMMLMLQLLRRSITTIRSNNSTINNAVCFRNISATAAAAAAAASSVQVPKKMKTNKDIPTVTTTSKANEAEKKQQQQDSEYELRDFSQLGAQVVLYTVRQLQMSSTISAIMKVMDGNMIEPRKYQRYTNPLRVQQAIQKYKNEMNPTTYTSGYYRDIMQLLIQQGYIQDNVKR